MKFYKIRHVPTGLFKASGHNGNFNTVGKLWNERTLKTHLRQFETARATLYGVLLSDQVNEVYLTEARSKKKFPVDECVVDEFELIPKGSESLRDFLDYRMPRVAHR